MTGIICFPLSPPDRPARARSAITGGFPGLSYPTVLILSAYATRMGHSVVPATLEVRQQGSPVQCLALRRFQRVPRRPAPSLHHVVISWLNPTPHAITVYASDPAWPRRPQHSLPGGSLPLTRTGLAPVGSRQLRQAHRVPTPQREARFRKGVAGIRIGPNVRQRATPALCSLVMCPWSCRS
jgi:hypothetical protein